MAAPAVTALETASGVCGNEVLARAARDASKNVVLGRRLSDEFERSGHFPAVMTHMIAVGERSGKLEEMLTRVADAFAFFDRSLEGREFLAGEEAFLRLCAGTAVLAAAYAALNLRRAAR